MRVALALHVIGVVMWIGSLLLLTRISKIAIDKGCEDQMMPSLLRLFKFWTVPGIVLVVGSGLHQLGVRGTAFYMKQGWFHGKLAFVLFLMILSYVVWVRLTRSARGEMVSGGKFMALHGMSGMFFLVIVFLTFLFKV